MSNIGIQLKNLALRKSQPVLPKELLAICFYHDGATKYYYSTLGKKTGWRSYDNTMKMLSRPLNPSIQDTTPDFLLNPSNPSRNLRNLEEKDTTPTWSGIIKNNTLFLRVSSLEYDSLKESIMSKNLTVEMFDFTDRVLTKAVKGL
ncbi:13825_t:CDS:2 [Rhizophagus irregularis]|nr:13825_t:CDS:2 [Rhizophagus irregularis]